MEENAEIIFQSRQNQKNPNYPDIIQQVDKIISKYKTQLEQLKPRKNLYSLTNTNNSFMQEDNINSNTYIKYNNEKKNKSVLTQEMENDNIKLGSALTLEKSKVVQLLNLLKIKENEINNLKQQIDGFEYKLSDLEKKYQEIIESMRQEQQNKINELYKKMSNEINKANINLDDNKKNNEILLEKYNKELNKNNKIIKIFFDFFNKNIEVYKKTEILKGEQNFIIKSKDYSEDKAVLAIETWDKLINKLFQDNKDLYNELVRLKSEMGNYNILMNQNTNYIQQENESLKQIIDKLTFENNVLKNENKSRQNQINNSNNNNVDHHHIIHSVCRHCNHELSESNIKKKNKTSRDVSPIQKLRLKINHLENQIKNKSFI
jgi:DNA repair exonuclease SbcCD ATPase subunit